MPRRAPAGAPRRRGTCGRLDRGGTGWACPAKLREARARVVPSSPRHVLSALPRPRARTGRRGRRHRRIRSPRRAVFVHQSAKSSPGAGIIPATRMRSSAGMRATSGDDPERVARRRDHGDRRPLDDRVGVFPPARRDVLAGEIDGDRVVPVLAQLGRDEMPIPRCPTASVDERERRHGGRGYLRKNRAAALSRPDSGIPTSLPRDSSGSSTLAAHDRGACRSSTLHRRGSARDGRRALPERLLVGVALIILPFGFVWGCLYWAIGEQAVALTPWAYVTGSAISLAVYARTGTSHSCAPLSRF